MAEGILGTGPDSIDGWRLAQQVAPLVERHPDLKRELELRYRNIGVGPGRALLERLFGEIGDGDDVIEIVKSYIATGRSYDGALAGALRSATLWNEPVPGAETSFHIRPASVAKLRKLLFEITGGTPRRLRSPCAASLTSMSYAMSTAAQRATHVTRIFIPAALGHLKRIGRQPNLPATTNERRSVCREPSFYFRRSFCPHVAFMLRGAADTEWRGLKFLGNFLQHDAT